MHAGAIHAFTDLFGLEEDSAAHIYRHAEEWSAYVQKRQSLMA